MGLTIALIFLLGATSPSLAELLSRNRHASQSSIDWNGPAHLAVDGNTDQVYFRSRSCTHTRFQDNPWWQVDLGSRKRITHVVIYNRADCCGHRLANFDVKFSDTTDPSDWHVCHHYPGAAVNGQVVSLPCSAYARFVRIQLRGRNYLTLCEVEVHGYGVHTSTPDVVHEGLYPGNDLLSLNKHTDQSSVEFNGFPRLAVDGNTDQSYFRTRSCTHTRHESRPWWLVDLGDRKKINRVVIYNRADCCGERLADFDVKFSDSRDPTYWQSCNHYHGSASSGQVLSLKCHAIARYVIIQLRGRNFLTLCEVQVYGSGFYDHRGHSLKPVHVLPKPLIGLQEPIIRLPAVGKPQPVIIVPQPVVGIPVIGSDTHTAAYNHQETEGGPAETVAGQEDKVLGGAPLIGQADSFDLILLSQGKSAYQSSLAYDGYPNRAVDGNTNQHFSGLSCTHTNYESQPFWAVDLGEEREVHSVQLYNRMDCCGERLSNFDIKIASNRAGPWRVCNFFSSSLTNGQIVDLACHGIARLVMIQLRGANSLTLCEVQIRGLDLTGDKKKKKKKK